MFDRVGGTPVVRGDVVATRLPEPDYDAPRVVSYVTR